MYLLHAFIDRAKSNSTPLGYEEARLTVRLHLSTDGQLLSLTHHPYKRKDDQRIAVTIPATDRTSGIEPKTAMDDATYLFGAGGRKPIDRHNAYMALMRRLAQVSPAAGAVVAFLESSDRPLLLPADGNEDAARRCHTNPDTTDTYPFPGKLKDRVLLTVEGHPDWWMASEVQAWHAEHLDMLASEKGVVRGTCSLCLEPDKVLVKTMGKSTGMGNATLVSANQPSLYSYGRQNAYTVPTCRRCARAVVAGMDHIGNTPHTIRRPLGSRDIAFAWWNEHGLETPWLLFDTVFSKDSTPEQRAGAIDELGDGHLAVIEKTGNARLGLRRYHRVRRDTVREAMRRWNTTLEISPWRMALLLQQRELKGSSEHDQALELLLLHLIGGEPIAPVLFQAARRRLRKETDHWTTRYLERFLELCASPGEQPMSRDLAPPPATTRTERYPIDTGALDLVDMSGLSDVERYAVLKGRAFAEAELMQIGRTPGGPQRTIGQTSLQAVSRNPARADDLITRHGTLRSRNGDKTHSDRLHRIQCHADEQLVQAPRRFTRAQQAQFLRGYRLQLQARAQERAWHYERKKLDTEPEEAAAK